jgi:hypothetical protein
MIPFLDLKAQYHSIKPEVDAAAPARCTWRCSPPASALATR